MLNRITLNNGKKYKLWGKSFCIIDWSNIQKTYCEIHGIDNFKESYKVLEKILNYIFQFSKLKKENIFVFVGIDEKIYGSLRFVDELKNNFKDINIISKRVKKIKLKDGTIRRKADFDSYIGCQLCKNIDNFKTFIIFSSDGDFSQIYEDILKKGKQLVVFHGFSLEEKIIQNNGRQIKKKIKKYNLGREVWELKNKYNNLLVISIDKIF